MILACGRARLDDEAAHSSPRTMQHKPLEQRASEMVSCARDGAQINAVSIKSVNLELGFYLFLTAESM